MICPNRSCQYLERYGAPAEWPDGTRACPACGARLEEETPAETGEPESMRLVAIAEFGEPHEAHLAKGRLEAEGVAARVAGEHLASLNALFADTGGVIRLEVAPADVDRAIEILDCDHSRTIADEVGEAPPQPPAAAVCPRCDSASVVEEEPAGGTILGALLAALRGRRNRCFTCGHRWKKEDPA
jgi:hypothetical protein